MPEMRRNPITKSWSIIATERAKRSEKPLSIEERESIGIDYDHTCFFCVGNEHTTPPEVYSIRENSAPDSAGWKLRVVPNKFAALNLENNFNMNLDNPLKISSWATGVAEVVIESTHHSRNIALFDKAQVRDVLMAYRERYRTLTGIHSNKYIQIFRNNGHEAGASLSHPHSQIIATPVIPIRILEEIDGAADYYDLTGRCVFCDLVRDELKDRSRIIYETQNFISFEPYASKTPYETWIMPKFHAPKFETLSDDLITELSEIWKAVLYKIYKGLKNPPYNYFIHTSPTQKNVDNYYHWHLEIIPKTTITAGFELGTGMYIDISVPEDCADFLREI